MRQLRMRREEIEVVSYNNILKRKLFNKERVVLSSYNTVEVANFHQHKKGRDEVNKTEIIYFISYSSAQYIGLILVLSIREKEIRETSEKPQNKKKDFKQNLERKKERNYCNSILTVSKYSES